MGEIYSRARHIISWLGGHDNTSSALLESIWHLSKLNIESQPPPDASNLVMKAHMLSSSVIFLPYWERMWIVQEVCLNRKYPLLLCGHTSINMEAFCTGVVTLWRNLKFLDTKSKDWKMMREKYLNEGRQSVLDDYILSQESWGGYQRIFSFGFLRFMVKHSKVSLGTMVMMTSNRLATNPADRVYALLGMLPEIHRNYISVDYGAMHMRAFQDCFASIWQSNHMSESTG
jgi:hypothetical protein